MHLRGRYLQELGVKYETVSLDLSKQEQKAEAYLKVGHCLLVPSSEE
jgi:glutaredoxin